MFARLFSRRQSTDEELTSLSTTSSREETECFQIFIDANVLLLPQPGSPSGYKLNYYIRNYIKQFKKSHTSANLQIFILAEEKSARHTYLNDLFVRRSFSKRGLDLGFTPLTTDELRITQYKLLECRTVDMHRISIERPEHTIVLTNDEHLLQSAREHNCRVVECFPVGAMTLQAGFLEECHNPDPSKQKKLSIFLNIRGTTIIIENGIERFNPHLLYFLTKAKDLFTHINLHFLASKRPPEKELCLLRQMLQKIIDVTESLKEEPKSDRKTKQELQDLTDKMYKLRDNIDEAITNHPVKASSGKEEAGDDDEDMYEEEHDEREGKQDEHEVVALNKKFPPLRKPNLKTIRSRLGELKSQHESFKRELTRLLEYLGGQFSEKKIIERFTEILQLETSITFTYLGAQNKTPYKISKIMKMLEASEKTKEEVVLFVNNDLRKLIAACKYREALAKQKKFLSTSYVYGACEPSLPSKPEPSEQETNSRAHQPTVKF